MKRVGLVRVVLLCLAMAGMLGSGFCFAGDSNSLMVYCGAGMRKPMNEIGTVFEKESGVAIHYNFAGSNALLSQMQLTKRGDAYMPGATMYIDIATEKGLIKTKKNVAYHIPVITVPVGNPGNVTGLADLVKPGVKVVAGDPKVAAIGKIGNKILAKNKLKEAFWAKDIDTTATMNELIVYIAMGQADAAINWWDTVKSVEKIQVVQIPNEKNLIKVVPIGTTVFSKQPELAQKFVDFVVSDKGKAIFTRHGFVTWPDPAYSK